MLLEDKDLTIQSKRKDKVFFFGKEKTESFIPVYTLQHLTIRATKTI